MSERTSSRLNLRINLAGARTGGVREPTLVFVLIGIEALCALAAALLYVRW
ncbi:MAG: hypothetical protein ABID40_04760 [Candidatus Bipolaricaulota bacterium]